MKAVVTGAAGFIGSHLVESLLADGHHVLGIDAFTDYYDPSSKERNLVALVDHSRFSLERTDLLDCDLSLLLEDADQVFHLAGQPGVRGSWHDGFAVYTRRNILATQQVLEACLECSVPRVVYASSSSVYGNALRYPTTERDLPRPYSPYGVSKLAAEHLCTAYAANFALHTVSVRYFTVYGPRQRPDMAIHRMIQAALGGGRFTRFGGGGQRRDFTYVTDAVRATRAAAEAEVAPGSVYNVGGGSEATVNDLLQLVSEAAGATIDVVDAASQPGDAERTGADISLARRELGWAPEVDLATGIANQVAHLSCLA